MLKHETNPCCKVTASKWSVVRLCMDGVTALPLSPLRDAVAAWIRATLCCGSLRSLGARCETVSVSPSSASDFHQDYKCNPIYLDAFLTEMRGFHPSQVNHGVLGVLTLLIAMTTKWIAFLFFFLLYFHPVFKSTNIKTCGRWVFSASPTDQLCNLT